MRLVLTPEVLAHAYDYLNATHPFCAWNLPASDDVAFKVTRSRDTFGWYQAVKGRHTIAISSRLTVSTSSLFFTMAHEMIHLHQRHASFDSKTQHNAAFEKLADQVCRVHGFDRGRF